MASIKNYVKQVQDMRSAQKDYFKTRSKSSLIYSKELEKKIDTLTSELLAELDLFEKFKKEVNDES